MLVPASPEELTADWLNSALQNRLGSRFIRELGAVQRIGEGYGFMATTVRLRPMVDGLDGPGGWPMVAKFANAEESAREIAFYRNLAPKLPIRVPRLFGGEVDPKRDCGVVLLSHVEHARQGDVLGGVSDRVAEELVRCLADLHAPFWNRVCEPTFHWLPRWHEGRDAATQRLADGGAAFLSIHGSGVPAAVRALIPVLHARYEAVYAELAGGPQSVIHDDFHLDNILFVGVREPVVLDWQTVKQGPVAVDVARLLVECLDVAQRRRLQARLFRLYWAQLRRRGVRGYGWGALREHVSLAMVRILGGLVGSRFFRRPVGEMPQRQAALVAVSIERVVTAVQDLVLG